MCLPSRAGLASHDGNGYLVSSFRFQVSGKKNRPTLHSGGRVNLNLKLSLNHEKPIIYYVTLYLV